MSSSRVTIDFYYDVASSWSYLAYVILKRYESIWNLEINMKPNLLGLVFKASGRSPTTPKNKIKWMMHTDMIHVSNYYGVKVIYDQPGFPPNTKDVMKFLRVIQDKRPDLLPAITQRFWEVGWGEEKIAWVAKPENFPKVLEGVVDEASIAQWLKLSNEAPYTTILRTEADKLVADGGFGNPWMVVTSNGRTENFWGSDRFEVMAHWLGKTWYGPKPPGTKAKI